MAAECVIIASNTPPVVELIENKKNGLLVDFFDYEKITHCVNKVFKHKHRMKHLGKRARTKIVKKYQQQQSINHYQQLIGELVN
jgi:glycosyltransferase involved in cell wall biosynthesis